MAKNVPSEQLDKKLNVCIDYDQPLRGEGIWRGGEAKKEKIKFVDLFCGIGGFHQAMASMGGQCVFASEIDRDCIASYKDNYGLDAEHDMTKLLVDDVPAHDVLCAGFPCQAFSKAGKQAGINDTRGTLFFEIERVLRAHHPRHILLENVRNLVSHDDGRTWATITSVLRDIGYRLNREPIVLSPHQFGVPQLRERVYIAGVYDPEHADEPLDIVFEGLKDKNDASIYSVLDPEVDDPRFRISEQEEKVLAAWDEFYKGINLKVIGFPVSVDYFPGIADFEPGELEAMPKWKQQHIRRNRQLYADNKAFIDRWLEKWNYLKDFTPTQRKFEWQAGEKIDTIFEGLIQMRPSGIRVKTPTVFPALVAMVQIPIIGRYRRRLTPRECARLQSFPESFKIFPNDHQAYKQFGNSVNVEVLKQVLGKLLAL